MKIKNCYIENFGKISNKEYNFNDGINSYIEDNGAGKSTLASFILAMLFGMDTLRKTDKDFKDRAHYAPFDGGSYGGTIEFEHNNKEYRIERTFDNTSSTKDTVTLYVDGVKEDYTDNFIENLIKLNKESFERLLFISSKDIEMSASGNIRKNLNNIISDSVEGIEYDKLLERIEIEEKKYSSKGKTSLVVQSKAIKKELEDEIKNQEIISEGLTKKYNSRKQVHDELEHLKKIQAESLEKRTINECWNTYESYLNDAKADEDKLDQLLNNYKNGYPTKDEVNELSSLLSDRSIVLSKKDDISFSEEKEERFNELSKEFKDGIPTDSELDEIDKSLEEHKRLSVLNSEEVQELSEEEKKILNKYSDKNYKEDFESITLKEAEYNSIDKKLRDTPRLLDQQNTDKPKSKLPLIMAISSIVLLGAGIGLLFVVQLVGIILLSFGGVLLLISGFLYLKGKIEASSNAPKTNAEYLMLDNNLKDKASEIHAILSKYNIYSESVLTDITVFKNEVNRFEEISTKEKSSIEKNTQNSKDLERLKKEISDFLNKYLEYESISKGLEVLKDNIKEFNRLSSERKEYLEDKETIENSLQKLNDSIKNIDDKYKLDILNGNTKLDDLRNDVSSIESLKESVINKNNRASLYKTQKNLTQKPLDEETIDYSDEIRQLDQDLLKIENEIDRDESDIDSLAENKNKLTELDAEIKKLEHKSMVLETLKDELIKAQTILDKKYVAPIMTKFNDYATKLGNALGMNIGMGRDFNILLEVNGKYKPYEHLSSGQMAICALCFRLALLDNIYNGDVPFIIMDDPFVSLDEKNIKSVQKLIQSLSNDKQILYLSCHKSRTI